MNGLPTRKKEITLEKEIANQLWIYTGQLTVMYKFDHSEEIERVMLQPWITVADIETRDTITDYSPSAEESMFLDAMFKDQIDSYDVSYVDFE